MKSLLVIILLVSSSLSQAQGVWDTFEGTRVLNNHSTDMLYKKQLEFIIAHKFGNMADSAAASQFFGFDDLADVRMALEYGVTNKFNIGVGRSKGVGAYRQVADGYLKYRILHQGEKPVNLTWVSSMAIPYGKAATSTSAENAYSSFAERLIFTNQLIVSRKVSDKISVQLNGGINHRNFVNFYDKNTLGFVGGAARYRFNPVVGMLVEYNHILTDRGTYEYKNPLSVGLEFLTGGHAFTFIFSNGKAVNENLFIPATYSDWTKGEFRLGFSITRKFKT